MGIMDVVNLVLYFPNSEAPSFVIDVVLSFKPTDPLPILSLTLRSI